MREDAFEKILNKFNIIRWQWNSLIIAKNFVIDKIKLQHDYDQWLTVSLCERKDSACSWKFSECKRQHRYLFEMKESAEINCEIDKKKIFYR